MIEAERSDWQSSLGNHGHQKEASTKRSVAQLTDTAICSGPPLRDRRNVDPSTRLDKDILVSDPKQLLMPGSHEDADLSETNI